LLKRWASVFLNEKLAPLLNHLGAELRVTGRIRDTALDLRMCTGRPQAQTARGVVACPLPRPLQAIAQIMTLQQIAWIVSCNGDVKHRSRGAQQLSAYHQAGKRYDWQQ
jgi:hypothetical protein